MKPYLWLQPTYQLKCREGAEESLICKRVETVHILDHTGAFLVCGNPELGVEESETLALTQLLGVLETQTALGNLNILGWDPRSYLADIVNISISLEFVLPLSMLNDIRVRYSSINVVPIRSIYTQNLDYTRGDIDQHDAIKFWTGTDVASEVALTEMSLPARSEALGVIFQSMSKVLSRYGGSVAQWLK
jgi:hypothetical protein